MSEFFLDVIPLLCLSRRFFWFPYCYSLWNKMSSDTCHQMTFMIIVAQSLMIIVAQSLLDKFKVNIKCQLPISASNFSLKLQLWTPTPNFNSNFNFYLYLQALTSNFNFKLQHKISHSNFNLTLFGAGGRFRPPPMTFSTVAPWKTAKVGVMDT